MRDMDQWLIAIVLDFSKEDQVLWFEDALPWVDTFVEVKSVFVPSPSRIIDVFVIVVDVCASCLMQFLVVDNIDETSIVSDVLAKWRKHANELLRNEDVWTATSGNTVPITEFLCSENLPTSQVTHVSPTNQMVPKISCHEVNITRAR